MRCIAYCNTEQYNLKTLSLYCDKEGIKYKFYSQDVIHLPKYKEGGDLFIFDYGCIVFWGYTKKGESAVLSWLKEWATGYMPETESDEFTVEIGKSGSASTMQNDVIILSGSRTLEKLSVSFALSQSVKLSTFEDMLDKTTSEIKKLPLSLAQKGKISLSRKEIAKKMGRLFLVRNSINLHSEMLDTPDFFWEHAQYENLYKLVIKNLDIPQRLELLNRRLDMIRELLSILGEELNHQHSSLLEWIIIILISVEIGLFVVKETHLFGL